MAEEGLHQQTSFDVVLGLGAALERSDGRRSGGLGSSALIVGGAFSHIGRFSAAASFVSSTWTARCF